MKKIACHQKGFSFIVVRTCRNYYIGFKYALVAYLQKSICSRTKPTDRISVGFIGIGSRGRTLMLHFRRHKRQSYLDLVAVCDNHKPHLDRALRLADDNASGFHDYRKMYDEVPMDLVVITTPLNEHAQMTIDSLDSGRHVYVEKSMA